jgi:hypothetical protein
MKRFRAPANMDDDEEVDEYKRKLAMREEEKENKTEAARNALLSDDDVTKGIVKNVNQIVENIKNGDSPIALSSAYMIVQDPSNLGFAKAVLVLAFRQNLETSADYKLFESLIGDELFGASDSFKRLQTEGKTVDQAVKALVDEAVQEEKVSAGEASRLKSLFSIWMKGVKWAMCSLSRFYVFIYYAHLYIYI